MKCTHIKQRVTRINFEILGVQGLMQIFKPWKNQSESRKSRNKFVSEKWMQTLTTDYM